MELGQLHLDYMELFKPIHLVRFIELLLHLCRREMIKYDRQLIDINLHAYIDKQPPFH